MSYRIGKTRFFNFGPFKDVLIDFSRPGLTLIEGTSPNDPFFDGNGSGKSFLIGDGPCWILFGRCLRPKNEGDAVIRTDAELNPVQEGAFGSMRIVGGEEPIRVCRYRGHPEHQNKLTVKVGDRDETRGTNDETQAHLERLIGMDYAGYVNSVAFGARDDVKTFFRATESERKQVMDSLMGFDLYSAAELVVKGRIRKLAEDIEERVNREEILQGQVKSDAAILDDLNRQYAKSKSAKVYRQAVKSRKRLGKESRTQARRQTILESRIADEKEAMNQRLNEYIQQQTEHRRREEEIRHDIDRLKDHISRAEQMTSDWKCEAAELRATPKRCPTCKQKIPADRCKAIRERIAAIESVAAKSESNTDKMAMELTLEKRKLKTLLDNMPVEPTSPDLERMSVKLNRLQSEQARTEGELSQITKRIRGLKKANAVILSQRDKLQERLATTQNKLKDLAEKLKKSRRKLSDLQAVSAAMGNGGIKSFLLEAELPAINAKATHYASRLIGPGAIVRLNATTTLKGGGERERLSVEGVIPGRTNRYASASKGQKLRMDLSLLLAFRDLCASRSVKSFNQLFADEIFDGVDKIGVERVAELLREISQACPVALVTHTDRLKQIGDRRIRVVHNGSYATVEESSVN